MNYRGEKNTMYMQMTSGEEEEPVCKCKPLWVKSTGPASVRDARKDSVSHNYRCKRANVLEFGNCLWGERPRTVTLLLPFAVSYYEIHPLYMKYQPFLYQYTASSSLAATNSCTLDKPHKVGIVGFYSRWHTFTYGYFFSRQHLHTWYSSSHGNLQQEWSFNVCGAVLSKRISAFRFHFRPFIL